MKKIFVLLFTFIALNGLNAQVQNDDCKNAINLGTLIMSNPNGHCFNGTIADTGFYGSNLNSIPNYPYPSISIPCEGYTPDIAVPANDVWYQFEGIAGRLAFFFECSDTAHISLWQGDSCSVLQPYKCITVAGDSYIYDTIKDFCMPQKLYMQISGNRIGKFLDFGLCFKVCEPFCIVYDYIGSEIPTPVLCFDYNLSHTDIGSNGNEGTATIKINEGNAPYRYQWSDGNTDSTRTHLGAGKYYVTITDKNDCTVTDSVEVSLANSMNENGFADHGHFTIHPNPATTALILETTQLTAGSTLTICNMNGQELVRQSVENGRTQIDIRNLASGVYFVKLITDKTVEVRKIIKE